MKKSNYIIFFSLLTLLSCNKNSSQPEYYGTASMNVNGINWETDKVRCNILNITCYNGKFGMIVEKFNAAGELRETFSFEKFTSVLGEQKIFPLSVNYCNDTLEASYATSQDDGDVAGSFYNTDTSGNNYLNIENYNPATKEISGSFSVTFVIVKEISADTTSVDTIRVTNGKFSTKILN